MSDILSATIKLDQFLKVQGLVQTGGQAKWLIQSGDVQVNGTRELRRGRKLLQGDRVTAFGTTMLVDFTEDDFEDDFTGTAISPENQ